MEGSLLVLLMADHNKLFQALLLCEPCLTPTMMFDVVRRQGWSHVFYRYTFLNQPRGLHIRVSFKTVKHESRVAT